MSPSLIEAWTLRIVDQVSKAGHSEDALVELKREWPAPVAAARILAAHANAAHGSLILWVIGLDEEVGLVGAPTTELADWYAAVRSCFDGIAPAVTDLVVPVNDKTLVALLFQTDRAPYVVKNPAFGTKGCGPVEREVPWREGRKTITARREHLVRMLVPAATLPEIECLSCSLTAALLSDGNKELVPRWYLSGELYLYPSSDRTVVLPLHKASVSAVQGTRPPFETWRDIALGAPTQFRFHGKPDIDSHTISSTSSEVIVDGPGRVWFRAQADFPLDDAASDLPVDVTLCLRVVGAINPVSLQIALQAKPPNQNNNEKMLWKFVA